MEHASPVGESAPCVIATNRLSRSFGKLVAVNALNLEVRRGDVFGFLGPNGSGKTTTIRMLLGLIAPTSGEARLFGMNIAAHKRDILPRIGAIIETPVFYPYLSGVDNLRAVAANSGMRIGAINERRIQEVLDLVDLTRQAKDAYRKYSLGMKQRLGIGAALLADPELILLDEPTNGLDPLGVHEIRELILRLGALGKTIFLSSHILYEVQQVCNRVAILQRGTLVKQGVVSELLRQGERIALRLDTPEETREALAVLQQARTQDAPWIAGAELNSEAGRQGTILLDAPGERASQVTALLARHNLYVAELAHRQSTLEEIFLELMEPGENLARRPGMAELVGATSQQNRK
jgi:ABC-2 type transport system ATP-binding protein